MPKKSVASTSQYSSEERASIGLILGTGLYDLYSSQVQQKLAVETKFGSAELNKISFNGTTSAVYLLLRHGPAHSIPPHLINYRANMAALASVNAYHVIATSSVGGIDPNIAVGSYVLVDQFIDQTTKRQATMFANAGERFAHTDMTQPYSRLVRKALLNSLRKNRVRKIRNGGTYVCTEGPRFETPAEISMYRRVGGDVVGMTGVPEVVLANELGMEYAALCFVTNMAAGLQKKISNEEVILAMKKHESGIKKILDDTIAEILKAR